MSGPAPPVASQIVNDAGWFPTTLDLQNGTIGFARTDRDDLASQPFLDGRWDRSKREQRSLRFEDVSLAHSRAPKTVRLNFIWHTAFCSSTAIAGALDAPGKNLSLREPEALTLLADLKRVNKGTVPADVAAALFALLARRFSERDAVTIKPSNIANYLLPEAATLSSGRWLMLYSDLRSFVTAVFRRGEQRRAHVREVFEKVAGDNTRDRVWPIENYFALTDLQIAAFCWHLQIGELKRAMAFAAPGRTASLDCDAFLEDAGGTTAAVDRFFELNIGTDQVGNLIGGTFMRQDAKMRASPFDLTARKLEWEKLAGEAKREIQSAVAWAIDTFGIKTDGPPLGSPLVPLDKDYSASK